MIQFFAKEGKCIDLGRRGEDSARVVLFDISGFAELYGQGKAYLIAKRTDDKDSYPAEITQDDTTVSWVIKPADNDQPGYGHCELVYVTDGSIVKSVLYQTHTDLSLSDPLSPPDRPSVYGDLDKKIESKLNSNQGAENAGKALVIGEDGNLIPGKVQSDVELDTTLTQSGKAADAKAVGDALKTAYMQLTSNTVLGFYCIEEVTIVTNGVSKTYPANSNVEIAFVEGDVFEIIPTSDNSILSLTSFPGALGTFYPWLEGVAQFSNILFDMNDVDMYSKWSQGNQGNYHVQKAQYINCIFWSDNPYVSDVSKRTNYTLTHTSQLPLCYSAIPDNTFKAFYLAFGVNSDPNWGNQVYKDSFAKATWATQVFSYYGARTIGIFGHDDPDFNIILPKDCRGLMCEATAVENAGTFDAVNVTNFGAKQGSWRDAFRMCYALRNLFIKNLKVNLNISWSPINYESIYYIISTAANTKKITISVSPYTYNVLGSSDFELAASKNINIELLTTNYVEDKRLSDIANKANKTYVDEIASKIPTDAHINELINAALADLAGR